jgi:DNA-binding NtrC family response regulator
VRAGLTEVTIPLALLDHASPTLHDLRLFNSSGEETPYSLNQPSRTPAQWITVESFESVLDHKNTVLFGKVPNGAIDALRLESPAETFLTGDFQKPPGTLREARAHFEREFIVKKLAENEGNISKTAESIGLERSHLHRKMKGYGIDA